jgi:hypothetical protein
MFTIRKEQLQALDRDKRESFVDRMLQHLREFFPGKCDALGENQLRKWIEHGIERAKAYRIVSERDVCKYIDVMIVFGKEFDRDKALPWASKILNGHYSQAGEKIDLLFEAAKQNQTDSELKRE